MSEPPDKPTTDNTTTDDPATDDPATDDAVNKDLEALLQRAIDAYETGGTDAAEAIVAQNAQAAARLRRSLQSLERMGLLQQPKAGAPLQRHVGDFRLLHRLGQGGTGVVWLAEQISVERQVAVKLLHPLQAVLPAARERFQREARALAQVRHPHVVSILAVGDEDGIPFLAMELVDGDGLDHVVAEAHERGTPPSLAQVARWGAELADALQAVHDAGLVHRDVKPGNVRITPDGRAVLLDFGLARVENAATLTRSGEFHGSPHFCSPEQVRGAHTVGPETDQFSLGATLYFALTGRFPFPGETPEAVLRHVLTEDPAPLRGTRHDLGVDAQAVLSKALEKQPERRYTNDKAMAEDLRALAAGDPVQARPPGPLRRLGKWTRRRPFAAAGLLAAFAAVSSVTGALVVSIDSLQSERRALGQREAAQRELKDEQDRRELDLALLTLRDLPRQIDGLWPSIPARIEGPNGMDAWLARADALLAALPDYQQRLETLTQQLWPDGASDDPTEKRLHRKIVASDRLIANFGVNSLPQHVDWVKHVLTISQAELLRMAADRVADPEIARQLVALTELVQQLPALRDVCDRVAARRTFAATVEQVSIVDAALAWQEAAEAVAGNERYRGFELVPQHGLVPLGPDRQSGLQEFAHLETGESVPRRNDDGKLEIDEGTGLVFVLIPPGDFVMGSNPPGAEVTDNVDPGCYEPYETPTKRVTLSTFLLSKYEMTQAQWQRITGNNPSGYAPGRGLGHDKVTVSHPVERMSWMEAYHWVRRLRLRLPTEAQWEYAARAGTDTPWWTGAKADTLAGAANLADRHAASSSRDGDSWTYDDFCDDGYTGHAPVGSYRPNSFGLHDILGNVSEWCGDWYNSYEAPLRKGDGMRIRLGLGFRVARGGSYSGTAPRLRCAIRSRFLPDFTYAGLGLRPMRRLEH